MKSGIDYRKRTRTRFVIYAVVAGPLMGLALSLLLLIPFGIYERFFGLEQHKEIAFLPAMLALQWFFPIGTGPALVTALYAVMKFVEKKGLELADIIISAAFGAVVGNFAAMVLTVRYVSGERSEIVSFPVMVFLFALPLLLSPICALVLWQFRPKTWIGPMTTEELEEWRSDQTA